MRRQRQAFTLFEVIVALALMVLVIGMAFMFLGHVSRAERAGERHLDAVQTLQIVLDSLVADLQAMCLPETPTEPWLRTDDPGGDSRSTVLQFWRWRVDEDGRAKRVEVKYELHPATATAEATLVRKMTGESPQRLTCWGLTTLNAKLHWTARIKQNDQWTRVSDQGETPPLDARDHGVHVRLELSVDAKSPLPAAINVTPVDLVRFLNRHWIAE